MKGLKLTIQLEVPEEVERVLVFSKDYTLNQVHKIIQISMGWQDLKDYYFVVGDKYFSEMDLGLEDYPFSYGDTRKLRPEDGEVFYFYDGGIWKHKITVEEAEIETPVPKVLSYKGDCPNEQIPSPKLYLDLLKANSPLIEKYNIDEINHILKTSFQ